MNQPGATLRVPIPPEDAMRRYREFHADLDRFRAAREWLTQIEAEQRQKLAALGDIEPRGNDVVWRKNREDIMQTLQQVRLGTRRAEMGELHQLAARDHVQGHDWKWGLDSLETKIAELEDAVSQLA